MTAFTKLTLSLTVTKQSTVLLHILISFTYLSMGLLLRNLWYAKRVKDTPLRRGFIYGFYVFMYFIMLNKKREHYIFIRAENSFRFSF